MSVFANDLERRFHDEMLGIYEAAKRLKPPYRANQFRQFVLERGGKDAADTLLATPNVSEGFTELFIRGRRLDLSVEYLVLSNPWRQLFTTEQLAVARNRLQQHEFDPPPEDAEPYPKDDPDVDRNEVVEHDGKPIVHICNGDPTLGHFDLLKDAAANATEEFDWWNITMAAKPGELAIFYMTAPMSAFVAVGVLGRKVDAAEVPPEKRTKWFGPNCFWMSECKMLPRAVTLDEAKRKFPKWSYLNRPGVTSIPNARTPRAIVEQFLQFLKVPPPATQKANDLAEPPGRVPTTTYRILRDTDLAREIKQKHGHKCQICGHTILLPSGAYYAEAHHIQPLGGDHRGLDVMGNVLCVCPNHHAELDYGVRAISLADLRCIEDHKIDPQYVDYHNKKIFKAKSI
jgi:hypothetical protein